MDDIYHRIRDENIKNYGEKIEVYGPVLLEHIYSDKTHFLYELLQNAEDACERERKSGSEKKFNIDFKLSKDKLEIRHNGILFDNEDLKGICGLVEGTKDEDPSQIGKFGIGFKSVYAYTKSPEIYSGDKCFRIDNYVQPFSLICHNDIKSDETLFVVPFNHEKISSKEAHHDIEKRLKNLGLRTLLFIRNLRKITWKIDFSFGKYSKECKTTTNGINRISVTYESDGKIINTETWLHFERKIDTENNSKVEIAYRVSKNEKTGQEYIVPTDNLKLFAHFPTAKPTNLNFLIQGPYNPTSARDNINNDEWNNLLIQETGSLVAESISKIKEIGLLDLSYLETLPIVADFFSEEEAIFMPIYNAVKDKLSGDEPLLPTNERGYTKANQALLGTSKPLRSILSEVQLDTLFKRKNWINGEITEKTTPDLRKYLMNVLDIFEIDPDRFARNLNEKFIKDQTDEWIIEFYKFLLGQKALWREGNSWEKEGVLRKKPIIRLEKENIHILPFDSTKKPLAYLPSKEISINKLPFNFVKREIVDNPDAKKFLNELKIIEPDAIAWILEKVLTKYSKGHIGLQINQQDHLQHVEWIAKTLKNSLEIERKQKLLRELKNTKFLLCKNIASNEVVYLSPNDGIYLGDVYTNNNDVETFFEGNDQIWLLDDIYKEILDLKTLEMILCKSKIAVSYRKTSYSEYLIIRDSHGWHERGVDGFDPDSNINGLAYSLETITFDKAKIIWNLLRQNLKQIYGVVETASHQDYSNKKPNPMYSVMGELLTSYAWLPDKNGDYDKPSNLILNDLPDDFDKESLEATKIGEILDFKTPKEQELYNYLPDKTKKMFDLIKQISETGQEDEITNFLNKIIEQQQIKEVQESQEEISSTFKDSLTSKIKSDTNSFDDKSNSWNPGLTPEQEDTVEDKYEKTFIQNLDETSLKTEFKVVKTSTIVSKNDKHINPKDFLNQEYEGHCQICNTRLDLGNGKSSFNSIHISNGKHEHTWSDEVWNLLCLCPNCSTLIKHGKNNNLNNIQEIAILASNHEIVPEPIEERNGAFYIANIKLVGQEKQIFYTPEHLRKTSVIVKIANDNGDT